MSDYFGFIPIEELNQENRRITEEQNQQVNLGHENQFMNDVNLHAERQIGERRAQGQAVGEKWTQSRKEFLKRSLNVNTLKHFPEKSVLTEDYGSKFKSRIKGNIKRLKKQDDESSRLFRKKENARILSLSTKGVYDNAFDTMAVLLKADQKLCDREDLCDLAAFMDMEKSQAAEIANLFLNENELVGGTNTQAALDQMLQAILSFDLGGVRLDNDVELSKNGAKLESLTWKIAAFDRLSEKYKYFEQLDAGTQKQINDKLDKIRSISDYYIIRRDIITDPMYRSHYNDEISMDFTKAENPQQTELAQKLLRAHIAGKNMMRKNGASAKLIKSKGEPKFQDKQTAKMYITSQEFIYQNNLEIQSIRNSYIKNAPMDRADRIFRLMEERKEADRLSKQNSVIPIVSESAYKDMQDSENMTYGVSEKQWEQSGGTTFKKLMAKEDADRLVKNSKGFLTAVKADNGLMEIKQSLPEEVTIKGKKVHLKKVWNLIIKTAVTMLTNEDGSFKTDQQANDTASLFADLMCSFKDSERGIAAIEQGLMQEFAPVMGQILKKNYEEKGVVKSQKEADKEAKGLCQELLHLLNAQFEETETGLLSEAMLDDCVYFTAKLNDINDELMEEYLKEYKFRETKIVKKIVDGKEVSETVLVEREATDEEIKAAVASIRKDMKIMNSKVKQLRDLDIDSKVVPLPHTCSANANLLKQLQTLCTGGADFVGTSTKATLTKNQKKLYQFMEKNYYLLGDAYGFNNDLNKWNTKFKLRENTEGLSPEELREEKEKAADLIQRATTDYSNYEVHYGATVPAAEEDGIITIESFAATPTQFIVDPFTTDTAIGQYKGHLNKNRKVTSAESFSEYYENDTFFTVDKVDLLIIHLNRELHIPNGNFRRAVAEKKLKREAQNQNQSN